MENETSDLRAVCQEQAKTLETLKRDNAFLRLQLRSAWVELAKLSNKFRDLSLGDHPVEVTAPVLPPESRALPGMDSNLLPPVDCL